MNCRAWCNPMFEELVSEETQRVRSWYGLPGEIAIEHELWHLVRVAGISLPHPPLINLVLRWGLPRRERLYLSFLHEFGHLQTLPLAVAHAVWLLRAGRWRGQGIGTTLALLLAVLVAHEAVWELASELYVVAAAGPAYRQMYRDSPNPRGQALFWGGMGALALLLTQRVVTQRRQASPGR